MYCTCDTNCEISQNNCMQVCKPVIMGTIGLTEIFAKILCLVWAQINKENENRIKNGKENETNTKFFLIGCHKYLSSLCTLAKCNRL